MPVLRAFVSHSFDDTEYTGGKQAFRASVSQLCERVGTLLSNNSGSVSIVPYFVAQEVGRELPAQLRSQLRESDFVLADLSGIDLGTRTVFNENVMFEIGYAMALELPVLFIRNKKSKSLPADIRDILTASYSDPDEIVGILETNLAQLANRLLTTGRQRTGRADKRIARTWFDPDAAEIHIICTPEPVRSRFASLAEPNYLFLDNLEDRDSLLEVSVFLARQYPKAKLTRHSADVVPADTLSGNLVVIGGPGLSEGEGNRITRELLHALDSKVIYDADVDCINFLGQRLFAETKTDGSIRLDWGCIQCAQNPMNPFTRVVVCHGIYTYGTLAAVTALGDTPGSLTNHLLLDDPQFLDPDVGSSQFEAVFPVPIIANGRISAPRLQANLIRRLLR